MTTASISELEQAIERLVQDHLAAYEEQVRVAVRAAGSSSPSSLQRKSKWSVATKKTKRSRRTPAELVALGKRFYAEVETTPGETMIVLAPRLGLASQVLEAPVLQLRKAERVRTVGKGTRMRYFPMAPPSLGEGSDGLESGS